VSDRGRILDRPLEVAWLDAAYRIAGRDASVEEKRLAVREVIETAQIGAEARKKTATTLNRVWVTPPAAAAPMIQWALVHPYSADMRLLHLGALLATHPFFGDVCAATGRLLSQDDSVMTPDLRARVKAVWGERRTVSNATQRAVKTLRALGVLEGAPSSSESRRGLRLRVPGPFLPWIAHALLLTRQVHELDEQELRSAPELFMLTVPRATWRSADYPLVERFTEGSGRVALVELGARSLTE
jgi:hypothetical protein